MIVQRTAWQNLPRWLASQALVLLVSSGPLVCAGEIPPDIQVFIRAGCPHCEAAKLFLQELRRERPSLHIAVYDIAENPTARQRLLTLAADQGLTKIGVPTFAIGPDLIVGFLSAETTGMAIRAALDRRGGHLESEKIAGARRAQAEIDQRPGDGRLGISLASSA